MTDFQVIASDLQFPEGPVACSDGSLFLVEIQRETITRIAPDGTVAIAAWTGGGPNGLAAGPDGALYVCNNGGFLFQQITGFNRTRPGVHPDYAGGRIERFDPATGDLRTLYDRCGAHRLCGPNDLVFDRHGGFYFTDFGKNRERDRDHAGLYYARADGSYIVEIAYPLVTANGVGLSPDESVVYVSETETGRVWAFDLDAPGQARKHPFPSPNGGRLLCALPGYQRLDSMALDAHGNLCIGTLISGCITVISPAGTILQQVPFPDPMVTNICFGGPNLRTAYVTLSGTGQLVAVAWPESGLPLPFSR
ncbi:SMP-30/gluconolactonase/LRE family protein [Methylobacterium nodulans]|uniref:SMP-30/Gluconolaconase/LRE domain protein n=1 Tax=Methylobacterium nodulans (strain LMG 21967 / CNCM I-2342 / ORS 2060) TaxID=460265 RepID=B8IA05_METNO|nr:SMP-30/gluconolactonase/LRE family protein [Methylobacterium nodulans]ACL57233.1 SMP-30/Gluconolaconase/LRE domain protein [Methylobacterium nodulans ORS 2060]